MIFAVAIDSNGGHDWCPQPVRPRPAGAGSASETENSRGASAAAASDKAVVVTGA